MNSDESNASNSFAGLFLSGLLAAYAFVAVSIGMFTAFAPKPIGGDAFNVIIAGIRGLAWIASAIVAAVLALLFFLGSRDQPRG